MPSKLAKRLRTRFAVEKVIMRCILTRLGIWNILIQKHHHYDPPRMRTTTNTASRIHTRIVPSMGLTINVIVTLRTGRGRGRGMGSVRRMVTVAARARTEQA